MRVASEAVAKFRELYPDRRVAVYVNDGGTQMFYPYDVDAEPSPTHRDSPVHRFVGFVNYDTGLVGKTGHEAPPPDWYGAFEAVGKLLGYALYLVALIVGIVIAAMFGGLNRSRSRNRRGF